MANNAIYDSPRIVDMLPSSWAVTFIRSYTLANVIQQVLGTWVKINACDKRCRQAVKKSYHYLVNAQKVTTLG